MEEEAYRKILSKNKNIVIGEKLENSGWEFLDCYSQNDCTVFQWKNRETGEILEVIGMQPPIFCK